MSPMDLFSRCAKVSLEEFGNRFSLFKDNAFRLEMLPEYFEPSEQPYFRLYCSGDSVCPEEFNSEWVEIIKSAALRGASFDRVRVPPNDPNDYYNFEVIWGYRKSVSAGENILSLSFDKVKESLIDLPLVDFWLFDSSDCFLMHYDVIGQFMGVSRVHEKDVPHFLKAKSTMLRLSQKLNLGC
jgi:hypothetical protein